MVSSVERVTVVIPTVGRPDLLGRCLASLNACNPAPAEVLVVDQSPDQVSAAVIAAAGDLPVRLVACTGTGRALAVNRGLREAREPFALIVDDDMTVQSDWVGVASAHLTDHPDSVITGRVLPAGDAEGVPSTITDVQPQVYTRGAHPGVLYAGNMGVRVALAAELGYFDEAITPAAEDCDFAYRWLRRGLSIHYVPELTAWHDDWRSEADRRELYRRYARGQGTFYAKHLRARDAGILRFALPDLARGVLMRVRKPLRLARDEAPETEALRGLPAGVVDGWKALARGSDRGA
jgi:GT2 family glycosyltransferase